MVANNRRFNVKIAGPQKEILALLKNMQGIAYAEALAERDGDAYTYMIESEMGVDIRKKLFFSLAERGWAIIGMEALGMNLEDIFISVVDKSEEIKLSRSNVKNRITRRQRGKEKGALEQELGASLYEQAQQQRADAALVETRDDED